MAESVKPAGDLVVRLVPRTEFEGSGNYRDAVSEMNGFVEAHGVESVAMFVIGADGETLLRFATNDRATALGMLFQAMTGLAE
jgi:hypothetical protein